MAYRDLRQFIEDWGTKGKLIRIREELSADLELAEATRYATYNHMYPLLFENVREFKGWKGISNIYGSMETIYGLFNTERLEEIGSSFIRNFTNTPASLGEKIRSMRSMLDLGKVMPKLSSPSFKLEDIGVTDIPAVKTWPMDAGRYFTYSLTVTKDPETGVHNLSVYRIQVLNEKEAIVHWQALKRGSLTAEKYRKMGVTKIPVAIVNGVDPITAFTAASPVPPGLDKYLFAGILRGEGVRLHELEIGVKVPADVESVLEGYVDLQDLRLEGPFGDHLGYYTPADYFPTFKLERAYRRPSPYFHFTSVGKPPLEDAWIGRATQRIFLPFLRMIVPELVDMNLPEYGLYTGIGVFSISKSFPGQGKKSMLSLWGTGQLSLLKIIVVVDGDVDVHNMNEVLYAIATTVDPARDVVILDNITTDSLDHTARHPPLGSKMGIDATRKFREEIGRDWPQEVKSDPQVRDKVQQIMMKFKNQQSPG